MARYVKSRIVAERDRFVKRLLTKSMKIQSANVAQWSMQQKKEQDLFVIGTVSSEIQSVRRELLKQREKQLEKMANVRAELAAEAKLQEAKHEKQEENEAKCNICYEPFVKLVGTPHNKLFVRYEPCHHVSCRPCNKAMINILKAEKKLKTGAAKCPACRIPFNYISAFSF